jgi:predicted AlkP superfamily pyrophosphatase or phosphodiesterase
MMSKMIQKVYGYTGYFQIYNVPFKYLPLFDYSEKSDLYQAGGINSGVTTIFDYLREHQIPFHLSDWRASETVNLQACRAALEKGQISFAYLYLANLDGILHQHGLQKGAAAEKVQWYERELSDLIKIAQRNYQDLHLYVFSDHGMTEISEECDLMLQIDRLGLKFGVDYVAMYDSTMARFWFLRDRARARIVEVLKKESRGRILNDSELNQYGCYFADHRYGELFFLLNPGVLLCPSFMGETRLAGMHGFEPKHPDSLAMFATNQNLIDPPQQLQDLYQLMLKAATS